MAFMLDDISGFLHSANADKKTVLRHNMSLMIEMLQGWCDNQPEGRQKFEKQIKRFARASKELESRTASV
ncbi:hypothetical protein B0T41_18040 [Chromobacterium violaceum]|nr:hypothetical protein B0T41_18040 [Chromobacterium violaceum]